jgi:hypothetical protein
MFPVRFGDLPKIMSTCSDCSRPQRLTIVVLDRLAGTLNPSALEGILRFRGYGPDSRELESYTEKAFHFLARIQVTRLYYCQ